MATSSRLRTVYGRTAAYKADRGLVATADSASNSTVATLLQQYADYVPAYSADYVGQKYNAFGLAHPETAAVLCARDTANYAPAGLATSWTSFALNTPRVVASTGLHLARAATNLINSPTFTGAVVGTVGSGGALPTSWDTNVAFIREIVSVSTTGTPPTIRVKLSRTGSSPSSNAPSLRPSGSALTMASPTLGGYVCSAVINIVSKSANVTAVSFNVQELDGASANVTNATIATSGSATTVGTAALILGFYTPTVGGNKLRLGIKLTLTGAGAATDDFDCTFDIYNLQVEDAASISDYTSWTPTTRATETLRIPVPAGTYDVFKQMPAGGTLYAAQAVTGQSWAIPAPVAGSGSNVIQRLVVLPTARSFARRSAVFDRIGPPAYGSSLASGGTATISGVTYTAQNAVAAWSNTAASNKSVLYRRFEVRSGDYWSSDNANDRNRSEMSGATNVLTLNSTYWVSGSFMLEDGADIAAAYFVLCQIHISVMVGAKSPPISLIIDPSDQGLYLDIRTNPTLDYSGNPSPILYPFAGFTRGVWHSMVMQFCNSGGAAGGLVNLWIDGTAVAAYSGPVGYNITASSAPYHKFGCYRGATTETTATRWADINPPQAGSLASLVTAPTPVL